MTHGNEYIRRKDMKRKGMERKTLRTERHGRISTKSFALLLLFLCAYEGRMGIVSRSEYNMELLRQWWSASHVLEE